MTLSFDNNQKDQMPFQATIHNGKIYGFFNFTERKLKSIPEEEEYFLVEVSPEGEKIKQASLAITIPFITHEFPRHNFFKGNFWYYNFRFLEIYRIPQEEAQWFSTVYKRRDGKKYWDDKGKGFDNFLEKYPKASRQSDLRCYNLSISGDFFHANTVMKRTAPVAIYDLVFSALVPVNSNSVRSFLLYDRIEMKTWKHQGTWNAQEEKWKVEQAKEPDEIFPSAFMEEFYVFVRGEDYYFVTRTGRLFLAKKPASGQKRQMRLLWQDEERPIVAILDDTDKGCTWLVAREKGPKSLDGWFLELKEEPEPLMFSLKNCPNLKTAEPLRTILQYDFIRRNQRWERRR